MEVLVRDIIKKAEEKLKEAGVVDFAVDSWLLAEFVFKINRTGFYMDPMMTVSKERADKYMELVGIRASKIPLQHITGSQEFMGLDFKVNEDVLIPRQDTELLVEKAITYIKSVKGNVDVLDMCTGSGCIAISIDRLCENAKVTAVDFSQKALVVAKENNALNKADVTFFQSDLFENVEKQYDVIVSNPPYIETDEIETLSDEVRLFDPMMALDGDKDGLKFYRNITEQAAGYLKRGGWLMYEIGCSQAVAVSEIMHKNGFAEVTVIKDLSGLDRVVCGKLM